MPTARELLEQADALMRRNRMGPGAGTATRPASPGPNPPTVGPTSGLPASPRTIQREPIAPSVARTSLPVDPTESPARVPSHEPAAAPAPPSGTPVIEPGPETEFPLLIDAVDEAKAAVAGPLDDLVDDVPVLTDAVEEIDVGIVDEAARGAPSFWELTVRGETSVLGPAPDSIVLVPPPEALPPAVPQSPPDHGVDPLGLDQPPLGYVPSDAASVAASDAGDPAGAVPLPDDAAAPIADLPDLSKLRTLESESFASPTTDFSRTDEPELDRLEGEPSEPLAPETTDFSRTDPPEPEPLESEPSELFVPGATVFARTDEPEPEVLDEPGAVPSVAVTDDALWSTDEGAVAAAESPAETSVGEAPYRPLAPVSENEQQRIREIAEEIGMQVLQRIDIFTDTTLRTQLGERLRPVVDRAAADLVAAINEHVGELLRVYISEAIEREIESWRNKDR
jgi:hypothetical protein